MKDVELEKVYSIRVLRAHLDDLLDEGYRSVTLLELLETIGFVKEDLVRILEAYNSDNDAKKEAMENEGGAK